MPGPLDQIAKAAKIEDHRMAGLQSLGGSTVTQHWNLADDKDSGSKDSGRHSSDRNSDDKRSDSKHSDDGKDSDVDVQTGCGESSESSGSAAPLSPLRPCREENATNQKALVILCVAKDLP